MYLQIKKAKLKKNQFGKNDIEINMVGLYEDDGTWVRRVKLNENTLAKILEMRTPAFTLDQVKGNK